MPSLGLLLLCLALGFYIIRHGREAGQSFITGLGVFILVIALGFLLRVC